MNVKTEICNLALRHIGTGKQIADVDTDSSDEAKIVSSLFDYWMKAVLEGFNWSFATVIINLEPIVCYPNQKWLFSYRYPADCLFFRGFWNGTIAPDDRTNMVPYGFSNDAQGRLIQTNWGPGSALSSAQSNMGTPIPYPLPPTTNFAVSSGDLVPVGEYTQNWSAIAFFPAGFIWGFSLMLAGWAAPSLPNIGVVDMREKNLSLGSAALNSAMARDRMEAKPPFNLVGELTKSRTGSRLVMTSAGFTLEPASYIP